MGWKIYVATKSKIVHKSMSKDVSSNSVRENLSWKYYYTRRNMIYTYKLYGKPIFFLFKIIFITIRAQLAILLFKKNKFLSSKILYLATFDGIKGYFDRKIF
jgi:GT2 family glycosyltransferase